MRSLLLKSEWIVRINIKTLFLEILRLFVLQNRILTDSIVISGRGQYIAKDW